MTVRSYYLLDDIVQAEHVVNALLDMHVREQDIHVIARNDVELDGLRVAELLQVSAIDQAAMRGVALGGSLGMLVGTGLLMVSSPTGLALGGGALLSAAAAGEATFGDWSESLVGPRISGAEVKAYRSAIESQAKVLVLLDTESEAQAVSVADRIGRPTSAVWLSDDRRAVA